MSTELTATSRFLGTLEAFRLLVGDIGVRLLLLLGLLIHATTVWMAFNAHEGSAAWLAAILSTVVPAIPEVYWSYQVGVAAGTWMHPYVLAVIGYPVACALFLAGGWLFFPERASRAMRATETD